MSQLRPWSLVGGLLIIWAVSLPGCGWEAADEDTLPPVVGDEPLRFKMNSKGDVLINKRWLSVFNDRSRLNEYFRKLADSYRESNEGEATQTAINRRTGEKMVLVPTQIVLEVEANTKAGSIQAFQRICGENGFLNIRVQVPGREDTGE